MCMYIIFVHYKLMSQGFFAVYFTFIVLEMFYINNHCRLWLMLFHMWVSLLFNCTILFSEKLKKKMNERTMCILNIMKLAYIGHA